jgi:hypothetical protein
MGSWNDSTETLELWGESLDIAEPPWGVNDGEPWCYVYYADGTKKTYVKS